MFNCQCFNYYSKFHSDDLLLFAAIANRQKSLGSFRCVLNSKIKNIPLVGFMARMVSSISLYFFVILFLFIDRFDEFKYGFHFNHTRENNVNRLRDSMKKMSCPVWVLIFPEKKKFDHKSNEIISLGRKFSIEHQLPILTHTLMPHVDVTHVALCALIEKLEVFNDFTIAYTKTSENKERELIHVILLFGINMIDFFESLSYTWYLTDSEYLANIRGQID